MNRATGSCNFELTLARAQGYSRRTCALFILIKRFGCIIILPMQSFPPLVRILLILICLPILLGYQTQPAAAQSGMAYDVIAAVNAYRAANGLPAYEISAELMSAAQAQSDYQASIQSWTHERPDGTTPWGLGFIENVAYSSTAQGAVDAWGDCLHMNTMIGYSTGLVGAGATLANGFYFITLDVKSTGQKTTVIDEKCNGTSLVVTGAQTTPLPTQAEIEAVVTSTANPDGTIVHIVAPGQSMWAIANAYGTHIVDIAGMNGLDAENPVIYPGQSLLIQIGPTATITGPPTETAVPPTRTPRPSMTPLPPTVTGPPTVAPTATPQPVSPRLTLFDNINLRTAGIIITIVCGIGLLTVFVLSIKNK